MYEIDGAFRNHKGTCALGSVVRGDKRSPNVPGIDGGCRFLAVRSLERGERERIDGGRAWGRPEKL